MTGVHARAAFPYSCACHVTGRRYRTRERDAGAAKAVAAAAGVPLSPDATRCRIAVCEILLLLLDVANDVRVSTFLAAHRDRVARGGAGATATPGGVSPGHGSKTSAAIAPDPTPPLRRCGVATPEDVAFFEAQVKGPDALDVRRLVGPDAAVVLMEMTLHYGRGALEERLCNIAFEVFTRMYSQVPAPRAGRCVWLGSI